MMIPGKVEQLIVFCDMGNNWFDDVQLHDIEKL